MNRLIWALNVLVVTTISTAAGSEPIDASGNGDLPALLAGRPLGNRATVTLVSHERTSDLHSPTVSTFIVDFAPGGSAVLQRGPSRGYMFVHVLSGEVTARAWQAGLGIYRVGETWAAPAFAYDIATTNAEHPRTGQGACSRHNGHNQIVDHNTTTRCLDSGYFA